MYFNQLALELARERQERLIEDHARARSVEQRPSRRRARPGSSIRQSVGRRVIAFGRWIAAEPSRELARSR
jgi:hypothetical protein